MAPMQFRVKNRDVRIRIIDSDIDILVDDDLVVAIDLDKLQALIYHPEEDDPIHIIPILEEA